VKIKDVKEFAKKEIEEGRLITEAEE